jgi:hypothetical protein
MPYLQAIWAAPADPLPLIRYADWLESVGLIGAAMQYRTTAVEVASGRLRPDYGAKSEYEDYR